MQQKSDFMDEDIMQFQTNIAFFRFGEGGILMHDVQTTSINVIWPFSGIHVLLAQSALLQPAGLGKF